jgi:Holin of 3TMs, for gene-transfer release
MGLNIEELIGGTIGDSVAKVVGAFKEDPTKKGEFQAAADAHRAEFQLTALKLAKQIEIETNAQAAEIAKAQIAVNEADAKGNWFQSSWRPLIGYICGAGLLYQELLRPLLNFAAQLAGSAARAESLDMGTLITLLFGLLGLGVMRTAEKLQEKD